MKIRILMENTARDARFAIEHGLSIHIETANHRILFDMGQTEAFAENARKMDVDLAQVDIAVLSHGHYDHGGGLLYFLQVNDRARVYANRNVFGDHRNARGAYIGLDPALAGHPRLILTDDALTIDGELSLHSMNVAAPYQEIDSAGLAVCGCNGAEADTFRHEQYLMVREDDKRVLFSGCSHKGICNIMHWFRPDVLVGGFHFKFIDPQGEGGKKLADTAEFLNAFPAKYYTCHCTGAAQYAFMRQYMGEKLEYAACGDTFEI